MGKGFDSSPITHHPSLIMDMFDQAQEHEQWMRDQALAAQRARGLCGRQLAADRGQAPSYCLDCGEEIPDARRCAVPGTERCVDCAKIYELKNKRRR